MGLRDMRLSNEEVARVAHAAIFSYGVVTGTVEPGERAYLDGIRRDCMINRVCALRSYPALHVTDLHQMQRDTLDKDHPLNVEWEALTPIRQRKFYLFKTIVNLIT